jgi:hypothetical protein
MAETTRQEATLLVAARIKSGAPFKLRDLSNALISTGLNGEVCLRLADAELRRWRRRKLVTFTRVGLNCIWELTATGHKYLNDLAKAA